ncbi:hypothetical protein JXM67_06560 [candidate division WOR-3 bacterium]|nr:hypothetical protein [candidate division WOR-3 bacterium]
MPKFTPKSEKKDEEKEEKKEGKKTPEAPSSKEKPKPASEEEELRTLEKKFSKSKEEAGKEDIWKKMKEVESEEKTSVQDKITEYEISRHGAPPTGSIGRDDPDFISQAELEKRRRELNMLETRIGNLEKEEQDINQRLDFLRKEHSAMELAIKEKAHLEREIAELRADRDMVKSKLDELKEQEGQLEQKSWEELKHSPAIGAKISALERRIHELEGQILELNEQRILGGQPAVKTPGVLSQQPQENKQEPMPEKVTLERKPEEKPKAEKPESEKPTLDKPTPESTPKEKEEPKPVKPTPKPEAEQKEDKKPQIQPKKKSRISF